MENKQLYWNGPGSLQWKHGEKLLQPGNPLTSEMIETIGEKSIKNLCKKRQIVEVTPVLISKQATTKKAQQQIVALTKERDELAAEIKKMLDKEPVSDKEYKKLLKNFDACKKDFGKLHEQYTDLKADYDLVITNINQLRDENKKFKADNLKLLEEIEQLKAENQKLSEEKKTAVSSAEETKEYNKSLHKQIAKLKKKSGLKDDPDSGQDSDLPLGNNQNVGPSKTKD